MTSALGGDSGNKWDAATTNTWDVEAMPARGRSGSPAGGASAVVDTATAPAPNPLAAQIKQAEAAPAINHIQNNVNNESNKQLLDKVNTYLKDTMKMKPPTNEAEATGIARILIQNNARDPAGKPIPMVWMNGDKMTCTYIHKENIEPDNTKPPVLGEVSEHRAYAPVKGKVTDVAAAVNLSTRIWSNFSIKAEREVADFNPATAIQEVDVAATKSAANEGKAVVWQDKADDKMKATCGFVDPKGNKHTLTIVLNDKSLYTEQAKKLETIEFPNFALREIVSKNNDVEIDRGSGIKTKLDNAKNAQIIAFQQRGEKAGKAIVWQEAGTNKFYLTCSVSLEHDKPHLTHTAELNDASYFGDQMKKLEDALAKDVAIQAAFEAKVKADIAKYGGSAEKFADFKRNYKTG